MSSSSFKFNMKHSGNRSSDRFSLWNLSMYFINDLVNFLLQRNNSCATVACWHMGRKLWTHILQSDKVCKRKRTNDFVFLPFDIKELSKWKEKIQITHFLFIFPCNITHDSKSKIFTYDTICYIMISMLLYDTKCYPQSRCRHRHIALTQSLSLCHSISMWCVFICVPICTYMILLLISSILYITL